MSVNREDDAGDSKADNGRMLPGARLSAARKERELSLKTVAEELKLDVRMVDAIERDDMDALPAAIFVKGYLRRYARLTGLPEDELVRDYSDSIGEPPPLSVVSIKQKEVPCSVTLGPAAAQYLSADSCSGYALAGLSFCRAFYRLTWTVRGRAGTGPSGVAAVKSAGAATGKGTVNSQHGQDPAGRSRHERHTPRGVVRLAVS